MEESKEKNTTFKNYTSLTLRGLPDQFGKDFALEYIIWVYLGSIKLDRCTVGAIIILSLADFVGLPTYKEWNCV